MYFVLTSSAIWQFCHKSFADQPWAASPRLEISDGEQHKTLATVERIWQFLLDHRATRDDVLVCVGGGVICDLGGFAASTYKRGMPHINVPTTLLAMVDAASGGKTGFDYAGIKNAIGTYAQPLDTLVIPSLIASLPPRELLSGYAEMLKHALLDTPDHWYQLLQLDLDTEQGVQALMQLIARSRKVKERIVAADPREQGLRRALNLGHTVGHALEAQMLASGHPAPHGYCIVWGMVAALYLSILHTGDAGVPACLKEVRSEVLSRQVASRTISLSGDAGISPAVKTQALHVDTTQLPRPACGEGAGGGERSKDAGISSVNGQIVKDPQDSPSLRTLLHQLEQVMLRYYGRPVCNCQDQFQLLKLMQQDKKNTAEGIRFTLLRRIGEPLTDAITSPQEAEEALAYLFSL